MTTTGETSEPSDATLIENYVEFRIADIHTAMPGEVIMYHPETNSVDVQPCLKRVFAQADGSDEVISVPVLLEVPISWQCGGGYVSTFPLRPKDPVLLIFCERSINQWHQGGGQVQPFPYRKHDFSDAIAIPGTRHLGNLIQGLNLTDLVVGAEDGSVEVRMNATTGEVNVTAATKVTLGDATGGLDVGRVTDSIHMTAATDPKMLAWMAAVSLAIAALTGTPADLAIAQTFASTLAALVPPGPPTSIAGQITSGSAKVSST